MKKTVLFFAFACLLFSGIIKAQITLRGKCNSLPDKAAILLSSFDGISYPVILRPPKKFYFKSAKPFQGFYNTENIGTIYLSKDYNLTVAQNKAGYFTFSGKGGLENNAIRTAKKMLAAYLPLDIEEDGGTELAQAALYLKPADFLKKLAEYKNYCKNLFNTSTDSFFSKYALLDIEYYCKPFIQYFYFNYGQDKKLKDEAFNLLANADTSTNPAATAKKYIELKEKAEKKKLTYTDRLLLHKLCNDDWNKNDETLFKNSPSYRYAFDVFFETARFSRKYLFMPSEKPEDRSIILLAILNDTVNNPYILNYYRYKFYSDIIVDTKDTATAGKYYRQFTSQNTRQDYYNKITETYHTKLRYSRGMTAPPFSFKTINNKTVTLQSLAGKYVYIDVWATWCGPCVKEIPYVQKLKEEYKGRNIEFVSISVDELKDRKKWGDYVTKNKLDGIQLIADNAFESDFIEKMGINSIPRFILIDPQGKLVETDALRPSDEELKKLLNKIL